MKRYVSLYKASELDQAEVECGQNLFKVEQDFEQSSQDYEMHNSALKQDLPRFFQLATDFITPIFGSFYYMQRRADTGVNVYNWPKRVAVQCIYVMLQKFQAFTGGKFDMTSDIEQTYHAKIGDAAEQIDSFTITKRYVSTGA